ncbi:related to Transcription regulatory protein SNF2 [Hanseniaspora guilliermondii]|uniref:Related to Transcription regulatory protein SNF2 n=1 Tax=Hanseniaspora guilliermondii TaxID=56406 RepID=A0A1L0B1N5_9ASCO|nr:related to Transcription regulatory protein SNF2 [Hanseniaspora guilliermondii]
MDNKGNTFIDSSRVFSEEEINRALLQWQLLKQKLSPEELAKNSQFQFYTNFLRQAAAQKKKMLEQKQQEQQQQQQQHPSVDIPVSPRSNPSSQQPPSGNGPIKTYNTRTGLAPNFDEILLAQTKYFQFLMQKKDIPADLKQLIENDADKCSIENYKPLVQHIGMRMFQLKQRQSSQPGIKDINGTIANPPSQAQMGVNNSPQMTGSNPPPNLKQQPSTAIPPSLTSPQVSNKDQVSTTPSAQPEMKKEHKQMDMKIPIWKPIFDSKINNLQVEDVTDPYMRVDTFKLPEPQERGLARLKAANADVKQEDVHIDDMKEYERYLIQKYRPSVNNLNHNKKNSIGYEDLDTLKIYPSELPEGIKLYKILELYQFSINLFKEYDLENCFTILMILDHYKNNFPENEVNGVIAEVELRIKELQLSQVQKNLRGEIIQYNSFNKQLLLSKYNLLNSPLKNNMYGEYKTLDYSDIKFVEDSVAKIELENKERLQLSHRNELNDMLSVFQNIQVPSSVENLVIRESNLKAQLKNHQQNNTLLLKEDTKRIERNAKKRLQALKENDEEAYVKLLDQTKDTRITRLLKQTNSFLKSLTSAVKDQQDYTKDKIKQNTDIKVDYTNVVQDENGPEDDDDDNTDYYSVAHRIKEPILTQPTILVGGQLKDYQLKGLEWMISLYNNKLNGILADEMGLGKTVQTLSLLTYLYEHKGIKGPFLVLVPLSTMTNWVNEFKRWAPALNVIAYKGTPYERKNMQKKIKSLEFDVCLTTFEYIIREKAVLSKVKWVHMIIDEGHRMKNAESKLSLTINKFYHTDYRLILTGTPLQNNLPELWALMNFVLPKIFNSGKSFDDWFNTPFANTGSQDKLELIEEETLLIIRRLHKVLRPFLLRRLKKDVEKELPTKIEKVIKCKKTCLQQILYEQMLKYKKIYTSTDSQSKSLQAKGFNNQIMQLKKICNHPFVFPQVEDSLLIEKGTVNNLIYRTSGKFALLKSILPKLQATNHRVLIFFQMTTVMDIMQDFLNLLDIKHFRLDGGTKTDERTAMLNEFNAPDSEYFCFLLSTRAGGLGLNLQTADTVIIFDSDWNPHQDLQAQDRAHRIGQKNEVRILRLITEDSVEEVILEKARSKLDLDGKVIQAGKFDNKSTAEEQEFLLRDLMRKEEERQLKLQEKEKLKMQMKVGELEDNYEDDDFDNDEVNELLARGKDDLEIFKKMDIEARKEDLDQGIMTRMIQRKELPDIYNLDIALEIEKERKAEEAKALDSIAGGRLAKRKTVNYLDDDSKWLKQLEVSDDEDGLDYEEKIEDELEGLELDEDGELVEPQDDGSRKQSIAVEEIEDVEPMKKKRKRGRPRKV